MHLNGGFVDSEVSDYLFVEPPARYLSHDLAFTQAQQSEPLSNCCGRGRLDRQARLPRVRGEHRQIGIGIEEIDLRRNLGTVDDQQQAAAPATHKMARRRGLSWEGGRTA